MTKDEAKSSSGQGSDREAPDACTFVPTPETLVEHDQNDSLLDAINVAYKDCPDHEERVLLQCMRRKQRKLVVGQWYPTG